MAGYTIYLIHMDRPIGQAQSDEARAAHELPPRQRDYAPHAQHYIGETKSLKRRLEEHRSGSLSHGSRLLYYATQAGIAWKVVRTWKGPKGLERKLKNRHNNPQLCPVCNPTGWQKQAARKGK